MNKTILIAIWMLISLQTNAQRNVVVIIADDLGKDFCDI